MKDNFKILIDKDTLYSEIQNVADEINKFYRDVDIDNPLNLVCVLKGGVMFFSQLVKYIKIPIKMEFVTLSSYGAHQVSSGRVKSVNLILPSFENEKVLIVEDIIDTGFTLEFLKNYIIRNCSAQDIKIAVLFDKQCARKADIEPDFKAFDIDDKFIVGFGMDYKGLYRNLDYIGYFEAT